MSDAKKEIISDDDIELTHRLVEMIENYLIENKVPKGIALCALCNLWIQGELEDGESLGSIIDRCIAVWAGKVLLTHFDKDQIENE